MKFSIVTPTYNSEKYLRETIESVLLQEGDFEIEYCIVDGLSKDTTVDIAKEYIRKLTSGEIKPKCKSITMAYLSEKDHGMYDAINKGFARGSGDIFAWINGDDHYLADAFKTVANCFRSFPEIEWLKGRTCFIKENGEKITCAPNFIFNQAWISRGIYGRNAYFIHQDSVFWRKNLWQKAGPIDVNLIAAGDYWLWIHFAEYAKLYSLNKPVSVFRKVNGSLSNRNNGKDYRDEQARISSARHDTLENKIKLFFWLKNKLAGNNTALEMPFRILYPLLFKRDQTAYIELSEDTIQPIMKKATSYVQ